jgi:ABC-2 type transport system permease protein
MTSFPVAEPPAAGPQFPIAGRPRSSSRPATPSFVSSVVRVFELSLGQMLWSRRSIFLALLVGGPVVLAAAIRIVSMMTPVGGFRFNGAQVGGATLFGMMIWLLYIRFIIPVLGVFYGTALIADEVDDRTITYLFTRPIRRGAILLGKYLAYLASTALLVLPSVVLVYFLVVPLGGGSIGASFPLLAKDLGILVLGLLSYGAVFSWVGARLKRPLVSGLVFALGWEPGVLLFPGYLKRLTVAYYVQALVPHGMPQESPVGAFVQMFREVPSTGTSLGSLAFIVAIALWFAVRAVEKREYVLEQ